MTPKTPFAPDPSKWIDTTTKTKGPLQRPLTSVRHPLLTPPPSTARNSSTSSRRRVTPKSHAYGSGKKRPLSSRHSEEGKSEQETLSRYLTPPVTIRAKRKGGTSDSIRENAAELLDRPHGHMNEWGSEDDPWPEAGPSRSRTNTDVVDLSRLSSSPVKPDLDVDDREGSTPTGPMDEPEVELPGESSSPMIPITPVPPSVLAEHRRLCGRDTERMRAIRSPWRLGEDSPLGVAPLEKIKVLHDEAVEHSGLRSSHDRPETKRRRVKQRGKTTPIKLTGEEDSDARGPLSPLRANVTYSRAKQLTNQRRSASPAVATSPVVTPKKPTSVHHMVTPPKSKSNKKAKTLAAPTETLYGVPPAQPIFHNQGKIDREWDPVEMEPETLLTWSLGGQEKPTDDIGTEPEDHSELVSNGKNEVFDQSIPSQSFPNLVHSSPQKDRARTVTPPEGMVDPASLTTTRAPLRAVPPPADRWTHLERGILSAPLNGTDGDLQIPGSTSKHKAERVPKQTDSSSAQTKLASFGFFPKTRGRSTKREAFDTDWDDENDLVTDEDGEVDRRMDLISTSGRHGQAGAIPEPPPHPELRPAGLQELKRRAEQSVHEAHAPRRRSAEDPDPPEESPTSADGQLFTTSSSSEGNDNLASSVEAWWGGLEERRSSEFGSLA